MKITQFAALAAALALSAAGCVNPLGYNLPPASRLLEPGPGVGGPGPGVLAPPGPDLIDPAGGGPTAAMGGGVYGESEYTGGPPTCFSGGAALGVQRSVQLLFSQPDGMNVRFDVTGQNNFDSEPLICPARQNFTMAGLYRLKITNIPDHEGTELYPTVEIGPVTPRTAAYLSHNAIPVQFSRSDFDQVLAGNYVTKVIYLPDPEFQVLAVAGGADILVSTKLDPGQDPIVEADQRGSIMAIIRLGNLDIEALAADGGAGFEGQVIGAIPGASGVAPVGAFSPEGQVIYGDGQMYGGGAPTPAFGSPYMNYPGGAMVPPNYISGVTMQPWGMPTSGTPIGLPGPPHIPLGAPAGLQSHWMTNHTHMHIPRPPKDLGIRVRQQPGMSYPAHPNRIHVREQSIHESPNYGQPRQDRFQLIR